MNTRKYDSPLREQQAARTRDRIVTAARELFADEGFQDTTVADVAAAAEVSTPTVYNAFGSKGGLLQAILTRLEQDADAESWLERVATAASARERLALFARWSAVLFGQGRALLDIARGARSIPEVAAFWDRGDAHRRDGVRSVVDQLVEDDALREGLDPAEAVDRIWVLTGPDVYLLAVEDAGWTDDAYVAWLRETLVTQVLEPSSP